jgi:transposase
MNDMLDMLGHWRLDVKQVRDNMYRAPTPRERERWHAVWLLSRGWSTEQVAEALERDVRTIAEWVTNFGQHGPAGMTFEQTGGSPPPSTRRDKRN